MLRTKRGEVWIVDLGLAAKVRPCVILSIVPDDAADRVLVTVLPHTTSLRGSRFEMAVDCRFLKPGAFDAQNVITVAQAKLIRRLGRVDTNDLKKVDDAVKMWLSLS